MNIEQNESSYARTRLRFDTPQAALRCASRPTDGRRRREQQCIRSALSGLRPGSRVLDLPCGTGYLLAMLVDSGFQVTAADVSMHMIQAAEQAWDLACQECPERRGRAEFLVQDIMHTTFPSGYFDAVVCNRLFHHFFEPAMRRAALAELRRICSGPIIVFYFDRFALDTLRLTSLRAIFGKFERDRFPIPTKRFAAEAASVGLELEEVIWKRWGISPQAYAVFRPGRKHHSAAKAIVANDRRA